MTSLQELNQPMLKYQLDEHTLPEDPRVLFERWMQAAIQEKFYQPNAMALATVDAQGCPHVRTLLLKSFDQIGFVFYTHYESQKGQDLATHSDAEMLFYWDRLERQVRIQGKVHRVEPEISQAYFESRARDSQIGAAISPQSQVIPDRQFLEQAFSDCEKSYIGQTIPRPASWGGYCLTPSTYEFWQGRPGRLHDRLKYQKQGPHWRVVRLAP